MFCWQNESQERIVHLYKNKSTNMAKLTFFYWNTSYYLLFSFYFNLFLFFLFLGSRPSTESKYWFWYNYTAPCRTLI